VSCEGELAPSPQCHTGDSRHDGFGTGFDPVDEFEEVGCVGCAPDGWFGGVYGCEFGDVGSGAEVGSSVEDDGGYVWVGDGVLELGVEVFSDGWSEWVEGVRGLSWRLDVDDFDSHVLYVLLTVRFYSYVWISLYKLLGWGAMQLIW